MGLPAYRNKPPFEAEMFDFRPLKYFFVFIFWSSRKVYGGIPTACHLPNNPDEAVGRVIKDVSNKWYDGKYLDHTMNGLDCYPVYMQVLFFLFFSKTGCLKFLVICCSLARPQ